MKALLLLLICLFSPVIFAQAPDFTIHQEYTSTRALGMGNAFTAVVDDHNAIFYNPAALAYLDHSHIRMMLRAGTSLDYLDIIDDIDNAGDDPAAIENVITKNYGTHLYSRVPTLGALYARPNWGIAFIPADFSLDVAINQSIGPALGVVGYLDSTLAYSYAKETKWVRSPHKIAVGGTVKAIHRAYYNDVINAGMLAQDEDIFDVKKADEGMTVDVDLGLLYIPKFKEKTFFGSVLKPSFSLVGRNLLDYGFPMQFEIFNDKDPGKPPKLERRFDVGSKWHLPQFWVFDPKLAVDIRDIGHRNWTPMKGFHAGAELYWTMRRWWKGYWSVGINQGYLTAGFGARMAWFQLDLATWGEEVGTSSDPVESRRFILEMSIDI